MLNSNRITRTALPNYKKDATSLEEMIVSFWKYLWKGTNLIKKINQVEAKHASPPILETFTHMLLYGLKIRVTIIEDKNKIEQRIQTSKG